MTEGQRLALIVFGPTPFGAAILLFLVPETYLPTDRIGPIPVDWIMNVGGLLLFWPAVVVLAALMFGFDQMRGR